MLSKEKWQEIYNLLAETTPLPVDCGQLCNERCCAEWESGVGMYLWPGEDQVLTETEEYLAWEKHWVGQYELPPSSTGYHHFVTCSGTCRRHLRPFECRAFPLFGYLNPQGQLELRVNLYGVGICPLVQLGDINELDPRFVRASRQVWERLATDPDCRKVMEWHSREFDAMDGPWKRLFTPPD